MDSVPRCYSQTTCTSKRTAGHSHGLSLHPFGRGFLSAQHLPPILSRPVRLCDAEFKKKKKINHSVMRTRDGQEMSSNDKSTKNSPAPGPTSEIVADRVTKCIVGLTGSASFAVFLVTGLSMQLCVGLVLRDRPMAIQAFNQTITITTDSKTAVRKRPYLTCLIYLTCPSFCFPLEPY